LPDAEGTNKILLHVRTQKKTGKKENKFHLSKDFACQVLPKQIKNFIITTHTKHKPSLQITN